MSCGHCRIEAEEDSGSVTGEKDGIASTAEGEVAGDWDEESIAKGRKGVLVYLGL